MKSRRQKRSTRILLVEDHANTLRSLSLALRDQGHDITAVSTMRSALEAVHEEAIDLIVCDIGLPDGDGWQFMEIVRARHGVAGIAMSGYGSAADHQRSLAAGFAVHLVKPFDPDELFAAIGNLLAMSMAPRSRANRGDGGNKTRLRSVGENRQARPRG
jgi:DNA-binding response OmpR family regulator